jgi:hypothetical protein
MDDLEDPVQLWFTGQSASVPQPPALPQTKFSQARPKMQSAAEPQKSC